MDPAKIKLTSSEIGALWAQYVNGTMAHIVNQYMYSIIEDKEIKKLFKEAIEIFEKQKHQLATFMKNEGFPIPKGFSGTDLNSGTPRLFSDIFV